MNVTRWFMKSTAACVAGSSSRSKRREDRRQRSSPVNIAADDHERQDLDADQIERRRVCAARNREPVSARRTGSLPPLPQRGKPAVDQVEADVRPPRRPPATSRPDRPTLARQLHRRLRDLRLAASELCFAKPPTTLR